MQAKGTAFVQVDFYLTKHGVDPLPSEQQPHPQGQSCYNVSVLFSFILFSALAFYTFHHI
jgi:hypothetical protein